jgi:hypothetical protein
MFWHGFMWGVLVLACVELASSVGIVLLLNYSANKREALRRAIDKVEAGEFF